MDWPDSSPNLDFSDAVEPGEGISINPQAGDAEPSEEERSKEVKCPIAAAHAHAMLDAAEAVAIDEGISGLTFEKVAKRCGLSKSGLLHHYPTKDLLIAALIQRMVDRYRADCLDAFNAQAPGSGRVVRGLLSMCLAKPEEWTEGLRKQSMVMIAALVHDAKHVEPIRELYGWLADQIRNDGLAPGAGDVVRLTLDGIWFNWMFGISEPTPARLSEVRSVLIALLDASLDGCLDGYLNVSGRGCGNNADLKSDSCESQRGAL
jgi:AcrR family transcriptional regulator